MVDLERILVFEQDDVHVPMFPLCSSTVSRFGRLGGLGMDRVRGKSRKTIAQLAGVDIVRLECREGLFEKNRPQGGTVVRELDQGDWGVWLAQAGAVAYAPLDLIGRGLAGPSAGDEVDSVGQLFFDVSQFCFGDRYVILQGP